MTRSITINLPNGVQLPFSYRHSPLMEGVLESIFVRNEYPKVPFLQPDIIVDIGANIGATAVLFSAHYPGATVYALEPGREAFDFLRQNTTALSNVRPFNVGAYDKDVAASLYLGSGASVTNSLVQNVMTSQGTEPIHLRRISTFFAEQGIDHVSLLKIDTEGAELPILSDLMPMLPRIDALFVEYHSESDRLELDRVLTPSFLLFAANSEHPHRGLLCFVSKELIAARTEWNSVAIARPTI